MQIAKENAACSICGKAYYMCMSCKDQQALSPWKIHTDTAEHYKVYQILHGVSVGVYTEQEAREKLNNVDLSDKHTFKPNILKRINAIMQASSPVANSLPKEEKDREKVDMRENIDKEVKNEKPFAKSFVKKK